MPCGGQALRLGRPPELRCGRCAHPAIPCAWPERPHLAPDVAIDAGCCNDRRRRPAGQGRRAVKRARLIKFGHARQPPGNCRSEEHTSELQSLMRISYAVFCLKKKKKTANTPTHLTKTTTNTNA